MDGSKIYLYGEGWDYAEVAHGRVGTNASQINLGGTGIGSFNDRLREGVMGGSPFGDPRVQGVMTGLFFRPLVPSACLIEDVAGDNAGGP